MAVGYKPRGNVIDYYRNNTNQTYTNNRDWFSLIITNDDDTNNLTIIVNSMSMIVKPGETLDEDFEDFNSVQINASGYFRIWLRG